VTSNLTLNGTVNPDFSQVEADASQFTFDPGTAIFFPEKRPSSWKASSSSPRPTTSSIRGAWPRR
jgi:hypothetical protein